MTAEVGFGTPSRGGRHKRRHKNPKLGSLALLRDFYGRTFCVTDETRALEAEMDTTEPQRNQ